MARIKGATMTHKRRTKTFVEAGGIVDGHLRQHLAVQLNAGLLQHQNFEAGRRLEALRLILPEAVILKRFLAPEQVLSFILAIFFSSVR